MAYGAGVGGMFTSTGAILVLFILLVIISRMATVGV
jgi:hypothetical protein